jgi:hypothetical protein
LEHAALPCLLPRLLYRRLSAQYASTILLLNYYYYSVLHEFGNLVSVIRPPAALLSLQSTSSLQDHSVLFFSELVSTHEAGRLSGEMPPFMKCRRGKEQPLLPFVG